RKTVGPATAFLVFMRYAIREGQFDMRMSIALDADVELGAVVHRDLSLLRHGSVAAAPWRWPRPASEWPALAESLRPDVVAGAVWLEDLLDLRRLAAHLEERRRFSEAGDRELETIMGRLHEAGVRVAYESEGFRTPKAGRIRPATVRALSYVYELLGDCPAAFEAWNDYLDTLSRPLDTTRPDVGKAEERRAVLAARCKESARRGDGTDE